MTGELRIGLTLWGFDVGVRAAVDLAVQAEQRGFASVFMVEGVFSNDALTTVAGMATCTSRITIGTGIANVFLRHPVMLGIAATAIDEMSGGRLVLGLGPNNESMITRAGLAWRDPRQALRETTDTVNDPYVPAVFTLFPDLRIHSAYDGYWFLGRPTMEQLRGDLRAIQSQVRSDWRAPAA